MREIRQNLSVYLERVLAGEALTITDRGRSRGYARAAAVRRDTHGSHWSLQAEATKGRGDLLSLIPPTGRPVNRLSETLLAMPGRGNRF